MINLNFDVHGTIWDMMMRKVLFEQLGVIDNMKILDFGSGRGITANYYAENNAVTAVEPSSLYINERCRDFDYTQIEGGVETLSKFEDGSFDVIFCHNVLEYTANRKKILSEFSRLLKNNGYVSVLKHNRNGRIMQMVVLLNNFEHAKELLDGKCGHSENFGDIHYYDDKDLMSWCPDFEISDVKGIRVFWDLQQDRKLQTDYNWQMKMVEMERKVENIKAYKDVAFFHHLILKKKAC